MALSVLVFSNNTNEEHTHMKKLVLTLLLVFFHPTSWAVTLEEYGVTLTGNGLVDHVSGLRWLDSSLTQGGYDELQVLLEAGWRIASEEELFFLMTRAEFAFSSSFTELGSDGLLQIADRLSFEYGLDAEFSGPWVCRGYSNPAQFCSSLNAPGSIAGLGGQFVFDLGNPSALGIPVSMIVYITEVPIYGSLACYENPSEPCIGEGRALLVRPVPIPAALTLFIGALATIGVRGRHR